MKTAYWAGVADSDGSFSISRLHKTRANPHYQAVFQLTWSVTSKAQVALDGLVASYGGSYCTCAGSNASRFKNGKPYYKYCITGQKLKGFLLDILPHVQLKKQQVLNLVAVLEMNDKPSEVRPRPKEKANKLAALWRYNKVLNTKNKPQVII